MRQLNIDTELKGNKIFETFLVMDKGTERDIQNGIYESIPVTNNSLAALCWSPKQPGPQNSLSVDLLFFFLVSRLLLQF